MTDYAEDFKRNSQIEARFEIPLEQAVVSGSLDQLIETDVVGKILDATVVDFKAIGGQVSKVTRNLSGRSLFSKFSYMRWQHKKF